MSTPHTSNQQLWAQFDWLLTEYEKTQKDLGKLQKDIGDLRGTARSADGLVEVSVAMNNCLVDLEISPRTYQRLSPSELAKVILEVTGQARKKLTQQAESLLAPFLPEGVALEDLMSGTADLTKWMPAEPFDLASFEDWWEQFGKPADPPPSNGRSAGG